MRFLILFLLIGGVLTAQHKDAINTDYFDKNVRSQDDMFMHVNGEWIKNVEIPSDRARWGSFDELREFTDSVSLQILSNSLSQDNLDEDLYKVKALYETYTNWDVRNSQGIEPITPYLDAIEDIQSLEDLQKYLIEVTPIGGNPFYSFYVRPHMKKSKINALYMGSCDLGMGRDYYHKDDENTKESMKKYLEYIVTLGRSTNLFNDEDAQNIIDFENKMAQSLLSVNDIRDASKRYNPYSVDELDHLLRNIDLKTYLNSFNIDVDSLIVGEKNYYLNLDTFITEKNLPLIKSYLKFNLINNSSNMLHQELDQLNFDFYSKQLRGVKEQRAMEKRGLSMVNNQIGEILGKVYVAETFPPEAKEKASEMVEYIKKSFEMHIKNLEWMSDATKVKALDKLNKFSVKIGYPDKWKDYSKLELKTLEDKGTLFNNMKSIAHWRFEDNVSKLAKTVDKTEWFMSPQTVNAYYSSSFNEIVFPAAILQPPFYDYKADVAVNFGGIGAVIGHEISHGFDDSGSQYDGDGNYNNWWTEEDHNQFKKASDALIAQYDAYEPLPDIHVNGTFTLGENIADLGGVAVAYDALQLYFKDHKKPNKINGFTPEQRFFYSWATIWRTKSTDEALANQVKTDPHSPGYFRANGPLINVDAYYEAFNVTKKDKMYVPKDKRITIW